MSSEILTVIAVLAVLMVISCSLLIVLETYQKRVQERFAADDRKRESKAARRLRKEAAGKVEAE